MRFITGLKFLSFFLSLSIAAPIAQYFESAPAGDQFDNGIEPFSNELSTASSSPGAASDNQFLMAARRQRPQNRRYRPTLQPPFKGTNPQKDPCDPGLDGSICQPRTQPTTIPVGEQPDTPDPLLDDVPGDAGGLFSTWGLWNLLNDPDNASSH